MRLTAEQVLQDDNRFANCNAIAELKYCGWEIPQRRAITNDEIRFYAWLCRSAVALLKEQKPLEPIVDSFLNRRCPKCNAVLKGRFCFECGQEVKWRG